MPDALEPTAALHQAIREAGGLTSLAKHLGVSKAAVWQWKSARVPAEHLPRIEDLTGVPGRVLRPDLYGQVVPAGLA